MTIPNIPTDNYYKFFALSGIVISITCVILFFNQYNIINDALDKIEIEISQFEIERKFIEEDSLVLQKDINLAQISDSSLSNFNIDSVITEFFKSNVASLQRDKNQRDFFDFLFKYEDKIIPILPKYRKLKESFAEQLKMRRALIQKSALINAKLKIQRQKIHNS